MSFDFAFISFDFLGDGTAGTVTLREKGDGGVPGEGNGRYALLVKKTVS